MTWGLIGAVLGLVFTPKSMALPSGPSSQRQAPSTRAAPNIEDIISAYGAVLEQASTAPEIHTVHPESKLPYPKQVIRDALEQAITATQDGHMKEQLKIGLICLDDFVPDDEVTSNPREQTLRAVENLRRSWTQPRNN